MIVSSKSKYLNNMSSVFDFHDDLKISAQELTDAHLKIKKINSLQEEEADQLMRIESEIIQIAENMGISLQGRVEATAEELVTTSRFKWDDDFFLNYNPSIIEAKVKRRGFWKPRNYSFII